MSPIIRFITTTRPKCTMSTPMAWAAGIRMGTITSRMVLASSRQPSTSSSTLMSSRKPTRESSKPCSHTLMASGMFSRVTT